MARKYFRFAIKSSSESFDNRVFGAVTVEDIEADEDDFVALRESLIAQRERVFVCLDADPFDYLQADLVGTGLEL